MIKLLKQEKNKKIYIKIVNIVGDSMSPTFVNGDKILISYIPYLVKVIKEGDIVVAKSPKDNINIIKRITKIKNNLYYIEGDNKKFSKDSNNFGYIKKDNILSKYILRVKIIKP